MFSILKDHPGKLSNDQLELKFSKKSSPTEVILFVLNDQYGKLFSNQ